MSFWNFIGLSSKEDYDALLEAVEGLTEKEEMAAHQLSASAQSHMQQAECQQKLLREIVGLQEQLTRLEVIFAEYAASAQNRLDNMLEQFQERQDQIILHVTNVEMASKQLEEKMGDAAALIQARMDASSDRYIENMEGIAASISCSSSALSEKLKEYYSALARGLRACEKQQISAQSDGFSNLETQITQLFDLLKCIWLSDLSSSLETMLPLDSASGKGSDPSPKKRQRTR